MTNVNGLKAALAREVGKLSRQVEAIAATEALIEVLEAQIKIAEKK